MKRLCVCAALWLAASGALAAKGVKTSPSNAKSLGLVGKPAPEFTLQDLEEHPFRLASTNGHVVLVAFWATWCGPCRVEMPALARLQKELAAQKVDVVLVALDNPAKARRFLARARLDARCLVDENGTMGRAYGVRTLPRAFVIDREGMVRHVLFGGRSETALRRAIEAARD